MEKAVEAVEAVEAGEGYARGSAMMELLLLAEG